MGVGQGGSNIRVVIAVIFVACIADASSYAADCNGNEREDDSDTRSGVSLDCNLNEVPDECEALLPKLVLDPPLPLLAVPGISSLLVSEFNGDGHPDIAVTRGETAEMGAGLTVLLGSPSNGNGSPRHIDGLQFESMITFDYEADGDIDILGIIITGNVEASIVVIANPGSGGPLEIAHLAEVTRGTLSLSDLDGDGSTDLAILGTPGFRVLRGRPGGRFAETADTIAARFHDSPGFGVDWDRDGFGDVVSSSGDDICVFHGGSALELNCETLRLAPANTLDPVERFLVADLDGDALPDLAEKRRDSEWLRVGLQDQGGRLASVRQYDVGGFIGSMLAEVATLSGHRDLFLIRSAFAGGVADDVMMLHGLGAGRLGLAERYPTARGSRELGVADFTGDGLPDLVLAENDLGSVRVWPQRTGQGTFDCDGNALLDSCELDCNLDGVADVCEILAAPERDSDGNGILDACEPDCNENDVPDATDIAGAASKDCDQDGMPDECQTRAELRIHLPQRIPIGESFLKVGGVDVDLDSDVDLVVASSLGNVIRVVRNDGHRRWSVVQSFPLAHSYRGIDSVELDGAPGPDVLLVRAGGLDLILNNGQGGFHVGGSLRPPGGEPENFTAGYVVDYDLDGVLDVVVSRSEPGEIGVFSGEGGGMFSEYRALADNVLGNSVKSEDMNGDGRPDVITGSGLLLQNVTGGLVTTPTLPVGAEVCIDTNGDGLIDLLQADSNQGVLLGRNRGGGRFDPAVILAVPGGVAPYVLLDAGDFDGDGIPDIVGRGRDGGLMVLRGGFPGAPRSAAWYDGYPTSVALADLDGDSSLDLAMISSHDSAVTLLHGQVGGALSGVPASPVSWTPLFLGGDLDGDGLLDLVTAEGGHSVVTLRGAGDGSFSRSSMFTAATIPSSPGLLHDLDMDGDLDIALVDSGPGTRLVVRRNDGSGRFLNEWSQPVEGSQPRLAAGRLNGDELPDILLGVDGALIFFLQDGNGAFAPAAEALPLQGGTFAVADLDGVPPDDVVVEEWSLGPPTIVLHYNRGGLEFHPVRVGPVPESPIRLDVVDLTRDGLLDVLAAGRQGALVSIQDRLGSFPPFLTIASAENAMAHGTADLDLDGHVDIILSRSDNVGMVLHRGDGTGQFGPAIPLQLQGNANPLLLAHVDGDARPDILFAPRAGFVALASNESGPLSPDCNLNRAPDECDLGSGLSSDVEGDGLPDECQRLPFRRGDAVGDGATELADVVRIFMYLFDGGVDISCLNAADSNGDGNLDVSDCSFLLNLLYRGGPLPPAPGAWPSPCGTSTLLESVGFLLGCEAYEGC